MQSQKDLYRVGLVLASVCKKACFGIDYEIFIYIFILYKTLLYF